MSILQVHFRVHTQEKPFLFSQCPKSFGWKANLLVYLLGQIGEKRFHCSQCPKWFARKACLQDHLRVHTGEKPFGCPKCSIVFSQNSKLCRFLMVHTREKPFYCSKHPQSFAQKVICKSICMFTLGEACLSALCHLLRNLVCNIIWEFTLEKILWVS